MFERDGANVSSTVTISFTQVMYMYLIIFVFSNLSKHCGHSENNIKPPQGVTCISLQGKQKLKHLIGLKTSS